MVAATKLTNNSQETFAKNLFGTDTYFAIPIFQRPYKWNKKTIEDFQKDLVRTKSEEETHFLGAIILSDEVTSPSEPRKYNIIDGQQRLTTIYLFICAAIKLLAQNGEDKQAANYFRKYIVGTTPSAGSNILLQPSLRDRAQLNRIVGELFELKHLSKELTQTSLKKLSTPSGSPEKGKLWDNYKSFERWLRNLKIAANDNVDEISKLLSSSLSFLSLVQIVVIDPTTGPTIYDSLNSKQEPMTIGELVKNGIFSKASKRTVDEIEQLEEHSWRPFYDKFTINNVSYFDRYFFPFGLTKDQNVKKQDTFNSLQKHWANISDPVAIINDLKKYQDVFLDCVCGTSFLKVDKSLKEKIRCFYRMGAPASLLPFLMQLTENVISENVSETTAIEILNLIETFLVRRAICGIEPTGLHAVFKRLWSDVENDVSQSNVKDIIMSHKTVQWPTNRELEENLRTRKLYKASICPYILGELDMSHGGDQPADKATIEHVLPQNPEGKSQWCKDFEKNERTELTDTVSNLVLLSTSGQNKVKNKDYTIKRSEYAASSMYTITRAFSEKYNVWTPETLKKRQNEIVSWALKKWHHSPQN